MSRSQGDKLATFFKKKSHYLSSIGRGMSQLSVADFTIQVSLNKG
jgi:hypothetical protein